METATGNTLKIVDIEQCIIRNSRPQYIPIANIMHLLEERQAVAKKYLDCPSSQLEAKELYGKYIEQVNTLIMEVLSIPTKQL